jgi:hypothetical protein
LESGANAADCGFDFGGDDLGIAGGEVRHHQFGDGNQGGVEREESWIFLCLARKSLAGFKGKGEARGAGHSGPGDRVSERFGWGFEGELLSGIQGDEGDRGGGVVWAWVVAGVGGNGKGGGTIADELEGRDDLNQGVA